MRNQSKVAPGWWDYTTLDREILDDAARLIQSRVGSYMSEQLFRG